jgi:hypothetical protein
MEYQWTIIRRFCPLNLLPLSGFQLLPEGIFTRNSRFDGIIDIELRKKNQGLYSEYMMKEYLGLMKIKKTIP